MNAANQSPRAASIVRLFGLIRPYWLLFIVASIALTVGAGVNLLLPALVRQLISEEYRSWLTERPSWVALTILAVFLVQAIAFYFRSYLFGVIGQRVIADVRRALFSAVVRRDIPFFDIHRPGDLVSRLISDTAQLQDTVSIRLSVFLRYSLQVVAGVALMLLISPQLTLAIVVVVPVLVATAITFGRQLRAVSRAQQAELGRATVIGEEVFSSPRVVKAFTQEKLEEHRFSAANEEVFRLGRRRAQVSAFLQSFVSLLMNLSISGVMLYGVFLVHAEALSIADLTAFLLYGVLVAVSFAFIAGGYAELSQGLGAAERVFELLDHRPVEPALPPPPPPTPLGTITLDQVCFRYPHRPETEVLHNVSFRIPAGEVTALVGPSGSGKSTIVNLLMAFYYPQRGMISFGDTAFTALHPSALRQRIAFVPQEPELFGVSIRENLRYGKPDASEEELRSVCAKVRLLDFIDSLNNGFDTIVGERGTQLSGGQKQRLAIARAILRDPEILILDEATSALDSENERFVQEAVGELMRGRTVLVIAHRLATVQRAQQVVVLDHGRVVQRGTHAELSTSPGIYRTMVERQQLVTEVAERRTEAQSAS